MTLVLTIIMKKNAQSHGHIAKVINVYQEKYANGKYCTGIGDFIRGSLCLLQYATLQNIQFEMYYAAHPISQFLCSRDTNENEDDDDSNNNSNNELSPEIHPYRVAYCNTDGQLSANTKIQIQKLFTMFIRKNMNNVVPLENIFPMYTIAFPAKPIDESHKMRIKNALSPTAHLQSKLDLTMKNMGIAPKQYNVIHVRAGDSYLVHGNELPFPNTMVECKKAFLKVFEIDDLNNGKFSEENEQRIPFVLISDSVELKKQMKKTIPKIIVKHHLITHTGENALNNDGNGDDHDNDDAKNEDDKKKVENTLIDFFIISQASSVYAFSPMQHGTGFSEQCCQIYNVPYSSHKLD